MGLASAEGQKQEYYLKDVSLFSLVPHPKPFITVGCSLVGTVVEHSNHHPRIEGSNPATSMMKELLTRRSLVSELLY